MNDLKLQLAVVNQQATIYWEDNEKVIFFYGFPYFNFVGSGDE